MFYLNGVFFNTLIVISCGLILNETSSISPQHEPYEHMTALFGLQSTHPSYERSRPLVRIEPSSGCGVIENGDELLNAIVLVMSGSCRDITKAINIDTYGGAGMIVGNDENDVLLPMRSHESVDISFPCVFVTQSTYISANSSLNTNPAGSVIATISKTGEVPVKKMWIFPSLMQVMTHLLIIFPTLWCVLTLTHYCCRVREVRDEGRQREIRIRAIPEIMFEKDLLDDSDLLEEHPVRRRSKRVINSSCPICLEFFEENKKIMLLPCEHGFHSKCIGRWIVKSDSCPICRQSILDKLEENENGSRHCCCSCWRSNRQEPNQSLLLLEDEESQSVNEISVSVLENFDEMNQDSLGIELNQIRVRYVEPTVEESVSLGLPDVNADAYDDYRTNSPVEYCLCLSEVEVKNGESVNCGNDHRKNDHVPNSQIYVS